MNEKSYHNCKRGYGYFIMNKSNVHSCGFNSGEIKLYWASNVMRKGDWHGAFKALKFRELAIT